MTSNTDISLKNFFVYNTTLGQCEGHEEEKIMYFYPRCTNADVQIKEVGLSEAIVKFTETFGEDTCDALQTQKTKKYFLKPEDNFWIIMTVNVPTCFIGKEKLDGVEYMPNEVQNPVYLAVLKQAYLVARLFLGPFQRVIDKDNGSPDLLKKKLDSFFSKYLVALDFKKCDIIDIFQGVQFLPLNKQTFLHAQCFINLFEATFPQVDFSLLLFNEQIVWSGLPAEDAQVVFRYLVSNLIPYFLSQNNSSDGTRTTSKPIYKFITGPENLTDLDVTYSSKVHRVYLSHVPNPGFYHLIVYRYDHSTLSVLIQGNEPVKLNFYGRMANFISNRFKNVNTEMREYKEQVPLVAASEFDHDARFVYFNSMNLAIKSTLDKRRDPSGHSVSKELLKLLVEVHQHKQRLVEDGCLSSETIMKTINDHWVVGKMSNNRQFYITLEQKKTNLVEVSEEVRKICDRQLQNIFFNV